MLSLRVSTKHLGVFILFIYFLLGMSVFQTCVKVYNVFTNSSKSTEQLI